MRRLPYLVFLTLAIIGCRSTKVGYQEHGSRVVTVSEETSNDSTLAIINGVAIIFPDNFTLPSATIEITSEDNYMKTTSDDNGVFSFNGVQSGDYLLRSNYVGLYELRDSIRVENGMTIKIKLVFVYDQ